MRRDPTCCVGVSGQVQAHNRRNYHTRRHVGVKFIEVVRLFDAHELIIHNAEKHVSETLRCLPCLGNEVNGTDVTLQFVEMYNHK